MQPSEIPLKKRYVKDASFEAFLCRKRFKSIDILRVTEITEQDYDLLRLFGGNEKLRWLNATKASSKLKFAYLAAQYMSANKLDEPEGFAFVVSKLDDNSWKFAIAFARFHKVKVALSNLTTVQLAMHDASAGLNSAMAGMAAAQELSRSHNRLYDREQARATSNLLNLSALYASYIDVCRRLRRYTGLHGAKSYDRAKNRLIANRTGQHLFLKDLRNFILHNELVQPQCLIHYDFDRGKTTKLVLESHYLLLRGTDWKKEARKFIQSGEHIDIIDAVRKVIEDVDRFVDLHHKLASKRLRQDKRSYDHYTHERERHQHLVHAMFDPGAIFKHRSSLTSRLIEKSVLKSLLESSLPQNELLRVLTSIADRHQNLPQSIRQKLELELLELIEKRIDFPIANAYLDGRKI